MENNIISSHDWLVIDEEYRPALNKVHETLFALGNGYMGVRGTPDEGVSDGNSIPGSYLPLISNSGNIQYDWCRIGFPTRVNAMITCPEWTGIKLRINGTLFDPQQGKLLSYRRELDMQHGVLTRNLSWQNGEGHVTDISSKRIVCRDSPHLGAIEYCVLPRNYSATMEIECGVNAAPATQCVVIDKQPLGNDGVLQVVETSETKYRVAMAMRCALTVNGEALDVNAACIQQEHYNARSFTFWAEAGKSYTMRKYVAVTSSRDMPTTADECGRALILAERAFADGFSTLLARHTAAWLACWQERDIVVADDPTAQQGIRFSIFNLEWNYAGEDPRLNIGAKGISGPGYGGLYFWDSEIYLLPYYLFTAPAKARNMLLQRYHTIEPARERAKLFGFQGAMYPFVTFDGTDCAIPWELGMLEQHINVAIPYAVRQYVQVTGDEEFLEKYGAEMVVETCRFWASRVCFNEKRQRYLINTVTGPDEYAMVVNNNCYTNSMTRDVMRYGLELSRKIRLSKSDASTVLSVQLALTEEEEKRWQDIITRIYIPRPNKDHLLPQDDSFFDMDPVDVAAIPAEEIPLLSHWPWERIIRSQVLKQPDVLLLLFLLNEHYSSEIKRANYDYYEPKTIHDSSLSPCIHAIMADELGYTEQAFDYYLRSSRLDLDDVNGNAEQGIHIAAMAGSWMSIVNGFAGMRLRGNRLCFNPHLPSVWPELQFNILFRGRKIDVKLSRQEITFIQNGAPFSIEVAGEIIRLPKNVSVSKIIAGE